MRYYKTFYLLFLILLAPFTTMATPQVWDQILINRQQFAIGKIPIPIVEGRQFSFTSSANNKGYAALWEIDNNKLYLKAFAAIKNDKVLTLQDVFQTTSNRIVATWFSGFIRISVNKTTETTSDARLIPTHGLVFEFKNGVMVKSTVTKLEVKDIDEDTFTFQSITNFNQDFRLIPDCIPSGPKYGIKYPPHWGLDILQENINEKVLKETEQ